MGRIQAPKRFLEVQQAYKALISADQGLGLRPSHGDGLTNEDMVILLQSRRNHQHISTRMRIDVWYKFIYIYIHIYNVYKLQRPLCERDWNDR